MEERTQKILVALDGSDRAFEAVRYVSELPCFGSMRVVLFNVFTKIPESYWDIEQQSNVGLRVRDIRAWETKSRRDLEDYIEEARLRLMDAGFPEKAVTVKIQERRKGIARDIITEAGKGYDAVALGRKGKGRIKELVLGSVATKVVERVSFSPLMVVGRCRPPAKILVALDTSDAAMVTVDYVGRMLSGRDCQIHLIHVVRNEEEPGFKSAELKIRPVFDMAKGHLMNCGFHRDQISKKIITGSLSRAGSIVQEARDGGYCTIVVGRRGLSKVREFFMGRVCNKVIQLARDRVVWVVN
jgi:nucleotide-binding universal stress UspA family protein